MSRLGVLVGCTEDKYAVSITPPQPVTFPLRRRGTNWSLGRFYNGSFIDPPNLRGRVPPNQRGRVPPKVRGRGPA